MSKDRHRKGYYHEYNLKHPERLKYIGVYLERDCIDIGKLSTESGEDDFFAPVMTTNTREDDELDFLYSEFDDID